MTNNSEPSQEVKDIASPPERSETIINRHRIVSYCLLEAAMRYRESFYREDVWAFRNEVEKQYIKEKHSPSDQRRIEKRIDGIVHDYELAIKKFNNTVGNEIDRILKTMKDTEQMAFDNFSAAAGAVIEEFTMARNTTDFLLVCKMYSMGMADEALEMFKNAAKERAEADLHAKNNVGNPVSMEPLQVVHKATDFNERLEETAEKILSDHHDVSENEQEEEVNPVPETDAANYGIEAQSVEGEE